MNAPARDAGAGLGCADRGGGQIATSDLVAAVPVKKLPARRPHAQASTSALLKILPPRLARFR